MRIANYKLTPEDRETLLNIVKDDSGAEVAVVETTESKYYNKLMKRGWSLTDEVRNSQGGLLSATFKAPAKCVSFRSMH